MSVIQSDDTALAAIKETTRPRYFKLWKTFVDFTGSAEELNIRVPKEEEILKFLSYLRVDKN